MHSLVREHGTVHNPFPVNRGTIPNTLPPLKSPELNVRDCMPLRVPPGRAVMCNQPYVLPLPLLALPSKHQTVCNAHKADVTSCMVTEGLPGTAGMCNQPCTSHMPGSIPPLKSRGVCSQPLPCPFSNTPTETMPHKPPNKRKCNSSRTPQEGLLNLLKHVLSVAEASLLKKGLFFVPTPLKVSCPKFENTLTKLCDRYKNRFSLPNRLERLINCSFEAIRYDLSKAELLQPEPNLTKAERLALRTLKKNKNIIITKADKGDTTVIMDTSHLIELAHKHLSDVNTYQLLKNEPTPKLWSDLTSTYKIA